MVQHRHDFSDVLFDFAKIQYNPPLIQFVAPDTDFNFPVVSVQIFTFGAYHGELMGGSKSGDHF
jgi:hypothetical protein